ncbi:hypothetical protein OAI64_02510 [Schleiferiaceae bacterium]|nr:hypothetical protein [Schleiferiaceae bacterium]
MYTLTLDPLNYEKIHHQDDEVTIASSFNIIFIIKGEIETQIVLPVTVKGRVLGLFRITRRLFRLDMCNVFLSAGHLIIIRNGFVYSYDFSTHLLKKTLKLKQCKYILHQSMCEVPNGDLYFGEYGMNPDRNEVNVYRSKDNGRSWHVVYTFLPGKIRHIHGCYYDKYSQSIFTLTGDFEGENLIQISDLDFEHNKVLGDGSQSYRAVNLVFNETEIHWMMDSPLEKSFQFKYNRDSGEISKLDFFNAPIWYLKRLDDGFYLAGSSVEKGEGVLTNKACLYLSKDLVNWEIVKEFKKDIWPMPYFKWGVMAFSVGKQTTKNFTLHFEGLQKVDGKSFKCSIVKSE